MKKKDIDEILLGAIQDCIIRRNNMTVMFCIEKLLECVTAKEADEVFNACARFSKDTKAPL
jgi:hypothetical protein